MRASLDRPPGCAYGVRRAVDSRFRGNDGAESGITGVESKEGGGRNLGMAARAND